MSASLFLPFANTGLYQLYLVYILDIKLVLSPFLFNYVISMLYYKYKLKDCKLIRLAHFGFKF